ncbi:aquaporin-like protein [Zychaea mexicana]|uniref:aquaporin-like protein n=1 Tax=Zychaea mexicana TaxID=64656 RepID=UPI0022FF1D09|nr:aquaporin-like protein [Zychaea mexicana]KAI9493599.1 aquaporin-like protein [Zychaea mexicana]
MNREEIVVDAHYPDHYEETIAADPSIHKGRFQDLIALGRQFRRNHREFLAEFIGTLILVLLVNGVTAEQTLGVSANSWLTVAYGNGMAVLSAISVCGHISGAHMNPAITIALWLFSNFPGRRVPTYCIAQLLGAFCGSALLYTIITPAIHQFDGGTRSILGEHGTATIFATYPPLYVGIGTAIASEVVGTALLVLLVMTTGHPSNRPFSSMQGVIIATGLSSILLSIGYTSGFSLNPARDIGPRLFTALAGWGLEVFTVGNYYAFVPMFAPLLGSFVGGIAYMIFIDHGVE